MSEELPSFEDAVRKFRHFLRNEDQPDVLRWTFREDVLKRGQHLYVRVSPTDHSSTEVASQIYDAGVRRNLGIHMDVLCFIDRVAYVYIWLPEDHAATEYRMLSGLRLSFPRDDRRNVVAVHSALRWNWLRLLQCLGGRVRFCDDLPCRPAGL